MILVQNKREIIPLNSFFLYDHLGNKRVSYSKLSYEYVVHSLTDYYPYGKILREYVSTRPRYLTTQHERDTETDLDYRGARYYDSEYGRFLSVDPLADKFPSWSAYNYVMGNPIIFIDPTGRNPEGASDSNNDDYEINKGTNKGGWTKNHLLMNEAFGRSEFNEMIIPEVAKLPSYSKLSANYLGNNYSPDQVYTKIGGKVLANHTNNPAAYSNSCALRLSYALNYSGAKIPYLNGKTGSGDDKMWYFYRVSDIKKYLLDTYGAPTTIQASDPDFDKKVKALQGIIAFNVSGWSDASGHITLWNGKACGDHCYFPQNLQTGVTLVSVSVWSVN